MEMRIVDGALEVRAAENQPVKLVGYAAVFNSLSQVIWDFREQIAPGAFAASLAEDDVRALWNHDSAYVLGRSKSGTLTLGEDEHGLWVEITPPDSPLAQSFIESVKRGDVSQMSFGFSVIEDDWSIDDQNQQIRTLLKVKLYEVSPVTFPAYTETEIAARSAELLGDKPERPVRATDDESNGQAPAEIEREAELQAQEAQRTWMTMQVKLMEVGDGRY